MHFNLTCCWLCHVPATKQNPLDVFWQKRFVLVGKIAGMEGRLWGVFWFHIEYNLYFTWFHQQFIPYVGFRVHKGFYNIEGCILFKMYFWVLSF